MKTLKREREAAAPLPSKTDMELARIAQRCIMEALDRSKAVKIKLESENGDMPPIELPPASLRLIGQLLGLMSEGRPFALMPEKQELTTVEAANFLNVSRPFVVKEIDAGRIPHRMVGSHRRILLTDLLEYATQMKASREAALDELSQLSQELGDY
jgi:excisionase family DNA binding protein